MRVLASLGFGFLLACAGGAEPTDGPAASGVASASASSSGAASSLETGGHAETSGMTAADGDGSSTGDAASSSGEASSSSTDAPAESSSSSGEPPPSCPNLVTCDTAEVLGMVSGDESSDALVAEGTEPTWITFQVTEDNDGVVGEAVTFTATLTSPASVDYDLFVYRGAVGGPTGCNGVMDSSTSATPTDVVHMSWGEAAVANGIDDRAWVAIEIVPKDPMCADGSSWSLDVDGDT